MTIFDIILYTLAAVGFSVFVLAIWHFIEQYLVDRANRKYYAKYHFQPDVHGFPYDPCTGSYHHNLFHDLSFREAKADVWHLFERGQPVGEYTFTDPEKTAQVLGIINEVAVESFKQA